MMSLAYMISLSLILFAQILIFMAHGEENSADAIKGKDFEQKLIDVNKGISTWIDDVADKIDLYFAGERLSKKFNKTTVILRNVSNFIEKENDTNITFVDVKLRLPNVENAWQLRFTSYDEDESETGINSARLNSVQQKENYGASVFWLKRLGDVNFAFKPRIKLKDPIETSYLVRLSSKFASDWFEVQPRFELFARFEVGTGEFFSLPITIPLSHYWSFFLINEEEYSDGNNLFTTNHSAGFSQGLNDRMSLSYSVLYENSNKPHYRLQKYTVFIAFSHQLYRQVLHYNFIPRLEYRRQESFSPMLGMQANINFIF